MKARIWILIVVLLIGAIGTGIVAGILISNAMNEKAALQEDKDRDGRKSSRDNEDEEEEDEPKSSGKETAAADDESKITEAAPAESSAGESSAPQTNWFGDEGPSEEADVPAGPSPAEENIKAHAAYADILTYIHDHPTEFVQGFGEDPVADVEYNSFAVADITDDGIDELVVVFTNTFMAGMYARVYTWDSAVGSTADYAEWIGAYCNFYHGGYLQEMATHNQSPSSLWPYSVSQYDAASRTYEYVFSAISVDASMDTQGTYYHAEDDIDGDGVIYYIYDADHDYSQDPEPLTFDVFQQYVNTYIPEINMIPMAYMTLTMDNINALK